MLPDTLGRTAPLRASGEMEIIFLVGYSNASVGYAKRNIRDFDVTSPVLFYGDGPCVPRNEWQVRGTPIAYLVDPQGVIISYRSGNRIPELLTLLEFYTAQAEPDPPLGLRCAWNLDSLPEVELLLQLRSPRREPLDIEIDYRYVDIVWDENGKVTEVNRIHPVEDGPELSFTVGFDDASELTWPVMLDAQDYEGMEYVVAVRIPGSDDWRDGGIWVWQGGELFYENDQYCRERAWSSIGPAKAKPRAARQNRTAQTSRPACGDG